MQQRDKSIDIIRGMAVFTMVAANIAATTLLEPHPLWLRLYGTFAASTFTLTSGMVSSITAHNQNRNLWYYLKRSGMLLMIAALLDMFTWYSYPFWVFDILYLLGFSTIIYYFVKELPLVIRCAIPVIIVALTPVLQNIMGYTEYPQEISFSGAAAIHVDHPTGVLNHLLVDGWVPLFPWMGFFLIGTLLGDLRLHVKNFATYRFIGVGVLVLLIGTAVWIYHPGSLMTRDGYSEMFYEPTIGYVLTAIGVYLTVLTMIDFYPNGLIYSPFELFGKTALMMYVLHINVILKIYAPLFGKNEMTLIPFMSLYLVTLSGLFGIAWGIHKLKKRWTNQPFLVKFLLGG